MASLWKHPASPFWVACFTVHSAIGPERWKRSTKTDDRKLAQRFANLCEEVGQGAPNEKEIAAFCEKSADRKTRAAAKKTLGDVFRAVHGREFGAGSLRAFIKNWLD